MASDSIISFNDVLEANKRISQFLHKTPVFTSHQADEKSGGRCIFFKAENLQKSGSFKARGALNAVLKCRESNNATCGVVIEFVSFFNFRYEACDRLEKEKNLVFIPPYDHQDVIAGQGTIGLEFLEQVPQLDAILIPVSGGGMSAGIAIAAKTIKPDIKSEYIFIQRSERGKRPWEGPPQYLETIADGIRLQQTGYITTPILIDLVEKQVFEMSDQEMVEGMKFAFERMKLVIEAASGAAVAAAFSQKMKNMDASIQNVGVILCGGNVDIDDLPW
uniref:L-serine ammonia-lyase n=1 Tax=Biomphalaria glabrata TaxID=6526 RepID=A0A2C9JDA5_BIOGL